MTRFPSIEPRHHFDEPESPDPDDRGTCPTCGDPAPIGDNTLCIECLGKKENGESVAEFCARIGVSSQLV